TRAGITGHIAIRCSSQVAGFAAARYMERPMPRLPSLRTSRAVPQTFAPPFTNAWASIPTCLCSTTAADRILSLTMARRCEKSLDNPSWNQRSEEVTALVGFYGKGNARFVCHHKRLSNAPTDGCGSG